MKAEGVNIEGGGCWARGTRGQRWRRCGGGDLIGDGLWYCYECFSSENELLFYCAVARLECRDGVSQQHDGDGLSGSLLVLAGGGGPCVTSGDVV